MLHKLTSIKNIKENRRLGRGPGSGRGKTSGRGTKGQKSRSGYNIPRRFEGGQTSLIQRLGKIKGFKSRMAIVQVLNIEILEQKFKDGDEINPKVLVEKKFIRDPKLPVKILGSKMTKKLTFSGVLLNKKLSTVPAPKAAPTSTKKPNLKSVVKPTVKTVKTVKKIVKKSPPKAKKI